MAMPSAYKADIRIHDAILREFARHPWLATGAVMLAVNVGVVVLTGDVDSFARKWTVTDIAQRVPGVRRVENTIAVDRQGHGGEPALTGEIGPLSPALPPMTPGDAVPARIGAGSVATTGVAKAFTG